MATMVDVYPNLDTLKREMRNGRDYRIRILDRASTVTILSPHGGFVDEGTSGLARAIAGRNYNLFDFQGLLSVDSWSLHVTSTKFRDPQLSRFLRTSALAVSVHGMDDERPNQREIWLGGLNLELKQRILTALVAAGFSVNAEPPKFRGEHPKNVVNLALSKGVQLELPLTLRKQMYVGGKTFYANGRCPQQTAVFDRFVLAVRVAVSEHARLR